MNESRSTAIITLTVMMLTGKKQRSTVLNARRTKFYEFRVQLHGISRARCSCTRYFFNATHQVKAIAIAVSKANPLVEIDCLL